MDNKIIRVLIVDDSALMRNIIGKILDSDPHIEIAGKAMNGNFALQKIPKLNPDIIILDLEMPEMNGIAFLKERKKRGIKTPVVILSSVAKKGAQITMEALSLGASDFIMKPSGEESDTISRVGRNLIATVKAYGSHIARNMPSQSRTVPQAETAVKTRKSPVDIIVIGVSTGGPNALREIFANLDPNLPLPILVVQHMPAGFTEEFAKSLNKISPLEVKEAKDGDLCKPGRILIAPGDFHLEVERKELAVATRLSSSPPVNGHRPSVDVLFASAAAVFSDKILAVIMTGMGRDGAREIGTIYRKGGITLGQDENSCVVYGMPKAAYENGFLHEVVPLHEMAGAINRIGLRR